MGGLPVATKRKKAPHQARNYKNETLRLYEDEHEALLVLCKALSEPGSVTEPTVVLMTAALAEATLLGFSPAEMGSAFRPSPPPPKNISRYVADVREDSYRKRLTITVHPLQMDALTACTAWLGAQLHRFVVGSMWRFIHKKQKAMPNNAELADIKVPARFKS